MPCFTHWKISLGLKKSFTTKIGVAPHFEPIFNVLFLSSGVRWWRILLSRLSHSYVLTGCKALNLQPVSDPLQNNSAYSDRNEAVVTRHSTIANGESVVSPQFAVFSSISRNAPSRGIRRSGASIVDGSLDLDADQRHIATPPTPVIDTGSEPFIAASHRSTGAFQIRPVGSQVALSVTAPPANRGNFSPYNGSAGFCEQFTVFFDQHDWSLHAPKRAAQALHWVLQAATQLNTGAPVTAPAFALFEVAPDPTPEQALAFVEHEISKTSRMIASVSALDDTKPERQLFSLLDQIPAAKRSDVTLMLGWNTLWEGQSLQLLGTEEAPLRRSNQNLRDLLAHPSEIAALRTNFAQNSDMPLSDLLELCQTHLRPLHDISNSTRSLAQAHAADRARLPLDQNEAADAVTLLDAAILTVFDSADHHNAALRKATYSLMKTQLDRAIFFERVLWEALAGAPRIAQVATEMCLNGGDQLQRAFVANLSHMFHQDGLRDLLPSLSPNLQSATWRELCNWEESLSRESYKENYKRFVAQRLPGQRDAILAGL